MLLASPAPEHRSVAVTLIFRFIDELPAALGQEARDQQIVSRNKPETIARICIYGINVSPKHFNSMQTCNSSNTHWINLKKCNHGACSSKQNMGRTNKSIFQDAKPVSTFSLKLLKISLRGLEQGWISSQLARLGPARAGSAQLVEDRRQATASDKADEPVQMLMNGKIF